MLHINNGEIVPGKSGDFGDGRGEAEEEDAVESFVIFEPSFEGFGGFGGGGGGGGDGGGEFEIGD